MSKVVPKLDRYSNGEHYIIKTDCVELDPLFVGDETLSMIERGMLTNIQILEDMYASTILLQKFILQEAAGKTILGSGLTIDDHLSMANVIIAKAKIKELAMIAKTEETRKCLNKYKY